MGNWNKYGFLQDLKDTLIEAINDGYLNSSDDIFEYVTNEIDRSVIYYSHCWEIAQELNLYDFTDFELGEAKNVSQLAYYGLYEYVQNEFDYNEIELLIEQKNAE